MNPPTSTASLPERAAWAMLLVLISGFALSQAFRTVAAIMAAPLQQDFGLSPQQLGLFAGAFHFSFGALQLFMGMGIDVYGPRRTVLAVFPLAVAGALVTALADGFGTLLLGQVLTGIGCAPAFLVCTVFIARSFQPARFAAVNGMALGIGSVGLLLTGTPIAWIIQAFSWRAGFVALAACAALAWLAILLLVREEQGDAAPAGAPPLRLGQALRGYGELFRLRHTLGIVVLALFTYAAFMALRGLWLGPLLVQRHGFDLVRTGHAALAISVLGMLGPPLFGRLDPGPARRRGWIAAFSLACAALFGVMAAHPGVVLELGSALAVGLLSGFITLQYADVRNAYPPHMTGRAMAVLTMAMFLGVALMQWFTGLVASAAAARGVEPFAAVLATIGVLLALATVAWWLLPAPRAAAPVPAAAARQSGA